MQQKDPLVSVVMITYAHEKYIRQAIEGVFLQKTNFPIEFIIANDCSSDNSDEIIKNIISKAPQHITVKYIKHEKNKGVIANFLWALKEAKGNYIALCEGDDYWISENKLQNQADFLNGNEDYMLCYHRVYFLTNDKIELLPHHQLKTEEKTFDLEEIAKVNPISTLSVMFRNNRIVFPDWIIDHKIGDYPLWLLLAEKGKIKFSPEIMGVYRNGVGIQSSLPVIKNLETTNVLLATLEKHFTNNTSVVQSLADQRRHNETRILYYKKNKYKMKLYNFLYKIYYSLNISKKK